jgi:hypothetical protein
MNTSEYMRFPIVLLRNLFESPQDVFENIADYAIVNKMQSYCSESEDFREVSEIEKFKAACKYFQIDISNMQSCIKNGKKLLNHDEGIPFTSIKRSMLMDFYNNESYTNFELLQLASYLAIKSIIGKNKAFKTNKKMVLARALGYSKPCPELESNPIYEHYQIRYHWEKLRDELKLNWCVVFSSIHARGFYVSTRLTYEQLAKINYERKTSTRLQKMKEYEKSINEKLKRGLL